jgi:hypothetical protein
MPPITPASKSGALITWLVVFVLLWVVGTVFAIYYYVDGTKAREELEGLTKQYAEVIPKSQLGGEDIQRLKDRKSAPDAEAMGYNAQMSLWDVLKKERDDLAGKIDGGAEPEKSLKNATDTLAKAAAQSKLNLTNLDSAVETLTKELLARQQEIADKIQQLQAAQETATNASKQMEANRAELAKAIAAAQTEAQQASATLQTDRTGKDEQIRKMTEQFAADQKTGQDQLAAAQQSVADLNKQIEKDKLIIDDLRNKLGLKRANTSDSVVRQADGAVVRVPGNGAININHGEGDQIAPGLTFEVYDRVSGIPALGDSATEEDLPKGKGALEVVRVGAGSSECRIIRQSPGMSIREGDLIANLVFDRNTKYQFFVYGDFDLDQNGVTVPGDADVVKSLVTRWGGKTTDQINANTDFVVLGKEPTVLTPTKEEASDPVIQAKAQASQAAFDAYQDVKRTALDYHIPVLNQNRFLYYVGYYESANP